MLDNFYPKEEFYHANNIDSTPKAIGATSATSSNRKAGKSHDTDNAFSNIRGSKNQQMLMKYLNPRSNTDTSFEQVK